ncbi:MAG: acetyl-CoA carboxylase biotin carboxyl carrier protein [Cyclobacteriaceae bacterium]|nr:acetyl-CoA carboxylase biotin carboxyl carrier protein [Cyclobacteriaceae bacterium]
MKTKEIQDLIDFISKSGLNEVNIETEELKISIKRSPDVKTTEYVSSPAVAQPQAPQASAAPVQSVEKAAEPAKSNYIEIKSPMIGTFYRSSNPESDSFVSVGDTVEIGQTVCIIEAMKLFNEIESDVSGKIVKVLVDNATPIEYDQPLFLVDPS